MSNAQSQPGSGAAQHGFRDQWRQIGQLEPKVFRAIASSFACFFCVLCSYYIIRPLRDEMGVTVGADGLERLYVIVFLVMLAAVPLFGMVVRFCPRKFVAPLVYAFFIAHLLLFWAVLSRGAIDKAVASTFFVWVSVFNLFVVSLFWIVMVDIWSSDDAKRFYGWIAAGGSAGAFCGPLITQSLVHILGTANLLLVAAGFLGAAMLFAMSLSRYASGGGARANEKPASDEGLLAGAIRVVRSPYLFKIAAGVLLGNLISTFFYFEQARIIGAAIPVGADRVQLFARMDLAVSIITILAQLFLTGEVIRRLGLGLAVAALPLSAVAGLIALSLAPVLAVLVVIIVAERAIGFSLSNPAARVLYTVVVPQEKYASQNFIDTVVFRGGDAVSGWIFNSLAKGLNISTPAVALLTIPFALVWVGLSIRLGREHSVKAAERGPA